jgi:hypothetical protein
MGTAVYLPKGWPKILTYRPEKSCSEFLGHDSICYEIDSLMG